MSLVTGLFFLVILLNQQWSPPLRLQASHCSTFRIMSDFPSISVFCSESIECFPGTGSKFFLLLLSLLLFGSIPEYGVLIFFLKSLMYFRCTPGFPIEEFDGIHPHFAFPSGLRVSSGPSSSEHFSNIRTEILFVEYPYYLPSSL